jgi:hypothetical protein
MDELQKLKKSNNKAKTQYKGINSGIFTTCA